jgi:hypothetical protein
VFPLFEKCFALSMATVKDIVGDSHFFEETVTVCWLFVAFMRLWWTVFPGTRACWHGTAVVLLFVSWFHPIPRVAWACRAWLMLTGSYDASCAARQNQEAAGQCGQRQWDGVRDGEG